MNRQFSIDLDAGWKRFVPIATTLEILGVVTRAGVPCGALARDPLLDVYLEIDGACATPLGKDETQLALALAKRKQRRPPMPVS